MIRHVQYAARLVVGGCAAAIVYVGETLLESTRVMVATHEEIDAGGDDPEPDPAAALTGLDAERWANDLKDHYHAKDDPQADGNCGHYDCRWCWVNATGATG